MQQVRFGERTTRKARRASLHRQDSPLQALRLMLRTNERLDSFGVRDTPPVR